jgi:hypothetical protein
MKYGFSANSTNGREKRQRHNLRKTRIQLHASKPDDEETQRTKSKVETN